MVRVLLFTNIQWFDDNWFSYKIYEINMFDILGVSSEFLLIRDATVSWVSCIRVIFCMLTANQHTVTHSPTMIPQSLTWTDKWNSWINNQKSICSWVTDSVGKVYSEMAKWNALCHLKYISFYAFHIEQQCSFFLIIKFRIKKYPWTK
jgi:hypothetical protein